ncbi:nucleotide-binding protein [Rhodococcus qingshengii]|uniref:Nucleotide-binding protein n=1 Tax=Rhodococcus qingshengii TaxID=334542 RepID=A0AAW6LCN2_RHOSG|nr:nucleotide-binding protein [Rhodococcus qingshengii]MDE8644704.1 nucleotide-binding protein [Rhodococcus qingshengii]
MDDQKKLELLEQQIEAANSGSPADFNLWRDETEVVLRNVLGTANPIYNKFGRNSYTLSVQTSATTNQDRAAARQNGVRRAISMLKAAQKEVELSGGTPAPAAETVPTGTNVFIVHGHSEARKNSVARFVRKLTGNEPIILHEQASSGKTVIEKFESHAGSVGYAVVLATADDFGRTASDELEQPRARQNVIFEAGYFFGALGRDKVALLYDKNVERPSDTNGIVHIELDDADGWQRLLAREIEAAGVGVDWSALR